MNKGKAIKVTFQWGEGLIYLLLGARNGDCAREWCWKLCLEAPQENTVPIVGRVFFFCFSCFVFSEETQETIWQTRRENKAVRNYFGKQKNCAEMSSGEESFIQFQNNMGCGE